ncbi:MAG TPA: hypothetical protein DCS93_20075 [Microscillaceae bacterium]|nr:hypothetical protein [Microscillaceae bacterium]
MSKASEIASRSFSEIIQAENSTRILHLIIHKLLGEGCAYDQTHQLILDWYQNYTGDASLRYVTHYIKKIQRRLKVFKKHRPILLSYLETNDFVNLEAYVYYLSTVGYSKKKIYDVFNDFFVFVEYHTGYSTEQADQIADNILDRLSGWSNNRLLPQEPDVQ